MVASYLSIRRHQQIRHSRNHPHKTCFALWRLVVAIPLFAGAGLSAVSFLRMHALNHQKKQPKQQEILAVRTNEKRDIQQNDLSADSLSSRNLNSSSIIYYEAIGPKGEAAYIADPQALLKARYDVLREDPSTSDLDFLETFHQEHLMAPFNATRVCNVRGTKNPVLPGGFRLLIEKIRIDYSTMHERQHRILCGVYTHEGNRDLARAAALTWGYKCDGFVAFSTETIPEIGMVHLKHPGPEIYENMWQKIRSIWAYIHDHYADQYDFFHLCGDDVLVVVENLRRFLYKYEQDTKPDEKAIFLGQVRGERGVVGGAGYTLNRVALRRLMTEILPNCSANVQEAAEDRIISYCFRRIGVLPGETRDRETGEQTYHSKSPNQLYTARAGSLQLHAGGGGPGKSEFSEVKKFWEGQPHPTYPNRTVGPKDGLDAAAVYSVAFHNLKTPLYLALVHAILYGSCDKGTNMAKSIQEARFKLNNKQTL